VLRRELTERLGLHWTLVEHGVADVVGVPRDVIEHFSKRRAEILEHQAEHGGRSARSAQVAALETRRAKEPVAVDRLRELWRSRAAEHGLDARAIDRIFEAPDRAVLVARPVATQRLTEAASTFGRPELLQQLAEGQPRGATVAELERLADVKLADRSIVPLEDGRAPAGLTEPRFTTRDMLAVEHELIDSSLARRHDRAGKASGKAINDALADRSLSEEQRRVVVDLCDRGAGVAVVRAPAGTGKTFALDAAREAWQNSGLTVVGCALSARAALELQDQAGIDSLTIARLRQRLDDGAQLPYRGVLVVDEAGMVGTRDLAHLAREARMFNTKLVLVGDDRQLPEIQAGGAFRALADRLGASELHEIRRQREPWDGAALDQLRDGEVECWARAYRDHGRITVARRASDARAALINDWYRADGDKLMIAARRDDVRDLNDRARQLLQAHGDLGADQLEVAGRGFAVGDRVVGQRNDRQLGILNGQRATVRAIDRDQRSVDVELDGGKRITLDRGYLDAGHIDHGYAITAHRAQGATVDRTFVLGSDELYREWGYTALSRHRDEARFYVTRADLDLDRDSAPMPDPMISGIERLMTRSHAKDLALDSLRDTDQAQLARERDTLHEQLRDDPPPATRPWLDHEVERSSAALDDARERSSMLQDNRDALPWRRRRERAELNSLLERNAQEIERKTETRRRALIEHTSAADAELSWLHAHGPDAERLLTVDQELRTREHIDTQVARSIERFHNAPAPLDRGLELPAHDLGPDLDLGM
jgi:Ti-type conjugative transfer relaxase TraA